jgi:hypothetical protein
LPPGDTKQISGMPIVVGIFYASTRSLLRIF